MRKFVHVAGVVVFAMHLLSAVLSCGKAAALWNTPSAPRATAFFQGLAQSHPWLFPFRSYMTGAETVLLAHFVPVAVISVVFVWLYASFCRRPDAADVSKVLGGWAVAFACAAALAYPLFTQDLWLSSVWGRMSAGGVNPYYVAFSPAWVGQLPLDHFPLTMSYGPLWGALSTVAEAVTQGHAALSFVIFKVILALCWLSSLYLLPRMMPEASALERNLAVLLFGWLPLSVQESLAEGHNDIAMASLALLWLFLLLRKPASPPWALAASTLCKYVTAPLFVVDLTVCLRRDGLGARDYALRLVPVILLAVVFFAVFFRSMKFFEALLFINSWPFLQPRDAILAVDRIAGGYLKPVAWASAAVFPLVAVHSLYRLWLDASPVLIVRAVLAVLCAVSFAAVNHLWPWYLIWLVPFAALVPHWWLSRFVIGLALLAPFTAVIWWINAFGPYKDVAALCLYGGALCWTLLGGRMIPVSDPAPDRGYGKTLSVS
ncbi:MAG: hypothetical protein AB7S92_01660 [Parvibaculaceae bacterium]